MDDAEEILVQSNRVSFSSGKIARQLRILNRSWNNGCVSLSSMLGIFISTAKNHLVACVIPAMFIFMTFCVHF